MQQRRIFFYLTLFFGLAILWPQINYQGWLAQGDHGLQLYTFQRILQHDTPYQDFWWPYGPLMLYCFAGSMKVLGVNILSVLTGKFLLVLATGLLIFSSLRTLWGPMTAFAGALWFYTFGNDLASLYNNQGGIFFVAAVLAFIAKYVREQKQKWLWFGILAAFLLALVKLNWGLTAVLILSMAAFLTDWTFSIKLRSLKFFFHACSFFVLPLLIFAVYWFYFYGLSSNEVGQVLIFGQEWAFDPLSNLAVIIRESWDNLLNNPRDLFFAIILILSFTRALYLLGDNKTQDQTIRSFSIGFTISALFLGIGLHEFLLTGEKESLAWLGPVFIFLSFSLIGAAALSFSRHSQALIWIVVLAIAVPGWREMRADISAMKTIDHYLWGEKNNVYIKNGTDWMRTVESTTGFLSANLNPQETFFALPYEPLYYYLLDRRSPTRMLKFSKGLRLSREQEEKVIRDLEKNHVNLVLLSSRIRSNEKELGRFGVDYCPLITRYFEAYFEPHAQFGDWENDPAEIRGHGTLILKRRSR